MEILYSLGVNGTLWYQLACFLVSYFVFSTLILKPYMAALKEREKRTVGSEMNAVRLVDEANELHADYEKKAKAINSEIKSFYDQSRTEATADYERQITSARVEATALLEKSREEISREVQKARTALTSEVPGVSAAIASKLAGKEIAL